jgi:glycosyl transferase, family 25
MKIYLINLDRDTERLTWMDAQLGSRELCYERIQALTPHNIPRQIAQRFTLRALEVLLPNNIACFSSHLAVAEKLLASEDRYCLVLEDDVEILCSADELRALGAKCTDFDILKLNDWPKCPTLEVGVTEGHRVIRYLQVPRGTGSYFLSRTGAEKLLTRAVGLAISTDNFLRAEAYRHLDIGGVVPPPIPQDRFGTSSLDPAKLRGKARNRRYYYAGQNSTSAIAQMVGCARKTGLTNFVRLWAARLRMKLNGVTKDLRAQYVLKG